MQRKIKRGDLKDGVKLYFDISTDGEIIYGLGEMQYIAILLNGNDRVYLKATYIATNEVEVELPTDLISGVYDVRIIYGKGLTKDNMRDGRPVSWTDYEKCIVVSTYGRAKGDDKEGEPGTPSNPIQGDSSGAEDSNDIDYSPDIFEVDAIGGTGVLEVSSETPYTVQIEL